MVKAGRHINRIEKLLHSIVFLGRRIERRSASVVRHFPVFFSLCSLTVISDTCREKEREGGGLLETRVESYSFPQSGDFDFKRCDV